MRNPMKAAVLAQQHRDLAALNTLSLIADERKEVADAAFERYLEVREMMREVREGQRNALEALRDIDALERAI